MMNENEERVEKFIFRSPEGEELPVRFLKYGPRRQNLLEEVKIKDEVSKMSKVQKSS